MSPKEPNELELSVLSGYKHPAKSIQSLRKDLLIISQLVSCIKNYRQKKDPQQLKRAVNLIIILSNLFEAPTLEYALYAVVPNQFWLEIATMLFVFNLSTKRKNVDQDLIDLINNLREDR